MPPAKSRNGATVATSALRRVGSSRRRKLTLKAAAEPATASHHTTRTGWGHVRSTNQGAPEVDEAAPSLLTGIVEQIRPPPPVPVAVGVAKDGQQPRPGMTSVEAVHRPERPRQGVLHQVLRVGAVAGEGLGHPEQHLDLGNDLDREPLLDGPPSADAKTGHHP